MSGYGEYRKRRKGTRKGRPEAEGGEVLGHRLTLLVVDDEREILRVLEKLFRPLFDVVTATGGAQGLERFRAERPELILSDQRMPGMSGLEMLRVIKDEEPGTTRMLLTGYSDIEVAIEAVNEQLLDRYLTKPWDNDELLALVRAGAESYLRRAGVREDDFSIYF